MLQDLSQFIFRPRKRQILLFSLMETNRQQVCIVCNIALNFHTRNKKMNGIFGRSRKLQFYVVLWQDLLISFNKTFRTPWKKAIFQTKLLINSVLSISLFSFLTFVCFILFFYKQSCKVFFVCFECLFVCFVFQTKL